MQETTQETHVYDLGKMKMIVEPVYQSESSETIYDLLLKLMKADLDKV